MIIIVIIVIVVMLKQKKNKNITAVVELSAIEMGCELLFKSTPDVPMLVLQSIDAVNLDNS